MGKRVMQLDAVQAGLVRLATANYQRAVREAQQQAGAVLEQLLAPIRQLAGVPDGACMNIEQAGESLAVTWDVPDVPVLSTVGKRAKAARKTK